MPGGVASLAACGGGDVAVLGAVASLGACRVGQKRKVGDASSQETGVRIARRPGRARGYPSYGRFAPAFSGKKRHQPFVFGHYCLGGAFWARFWITQTSLCFEIEELRAAGGDGGSE